MSNREFLLLERHRRLDDLLRLAQAKLKPDPYEVGLLKKMKLAIKDRLARLQRRYQS